MQEVHLHPQMVQEAEEAEEELHKQEVQEFKEPIQMVSVEVELVFLQILFQQVMEHQARRQVDILQVVAQEILGQRQELRLNQVVRVEEVQEDMNQTLLEEMRVLQIPVVERELVFVETVQVVELE
jgi:hypothetical protein